MIKKEIRDMIRNDFLINDKTIKDVIREYGIGRTLAYQLLSEAKTSYPKPHMVNSTIDGDIVGVIGDTHFPYSRKGYLEFCYETFRKNGVTRVVHIGDLVDHHAWSRHMTEPDANSGLTEYEMAYEKVQKMKVMFEEWDITLVLGNHDSICQRQVATLGLPSVVIKSFGELYGVPEWNIVTSAIIDNTEYRHGIGCTATLLTAQRIRRNLVCGHSHSKADIQCHANWDSVVWGMHVGSGVDDSELAFRYGKENVLKSIVSCATVQYGKFPQLHLMDLY